MLDVKEIAPEKLRPLRREEYDRMVELGLFVDERVELLRGALVEMSPQNTQHSYPIQYLTTHLVPQLLGRGEVRVQLPLAVSEYSEPEPDLAIVSPGNYRNEHPREALLIIEVASSSLRKDRRLKAAIYAEACVPEYWVVNLVDGQIEVHTEPGPNGYGRVEIAPRGESLSPRAFPDVSVSVEEIVG